MEDQKLQGREECAVGEGLTFWAFEIFVEAEGMRVVKIQWESGRDQ